ncbi:hypothetical protein C8F01DRAFT_1093004 [Mycena amicta]|nr:hypothetical protein C8F01DRAFT_1093004 [Mycena amicta]
MPATSALTLPFFPATILPCFPPRISVNSIFQRLRKMPTTLSFNVYTLDGLDLRWTMASEDRQSDDATARVHLSVLWHEQHQRIVGPSSNPIRILRKAGNRLTQVCIKRGALPCTSSPSSNGYFAWDNKYMQCLSAPERRASGARVELPDMDPSSLSDPLAGLLDLLLHGCIDDGGLKAEILRPLRSSGNDRFRILAGQVQEYKHRSYTDQDYIDNIAQGLIQFLPTRAFLFPHLRSLEWYVTAINSDLLPSLLSPTLRHLRIDAGNPSYGFKVLRYLDGVGPLQGLRVQTSWESHDYWSAPLICGRDISSVIRLSPQLTTLILIDIDSEAFMLASQLVCLETLQLDIFPEEVECNTTTTDNFSSFFPRLAIFSVGAADLPAVTKALPLFQSSPLSTFAVGPSGDMTDELLHRLLDSCVTHLNPATLTTFEVEYCYIRGVVEGFYEKRWAIRRCNFLAILGFRALEKLKMTAGAGFHKLDDDCVLKVVTELHNLEELSLVQEASDVATPFTTGLLLHLRFLAPSLRRLEITFQPRPLSMGHEHPTDAPSSKLSLLNVGFSMIRSSAAMAEFLRGLFPSLATVHSSWSGGEGYFDDDTDEALAAQWDRVDAILSGHDLEGEEQRYRVVVEVADC